MSRSDDVRRTSLLMTAAVAGALVLGVVAVVAHSTWAGVGALVLLTPVLIALVLRVISRL